MTSPLRAAARRAVWRLAAVAAVVAAAPAPAAMAGSVADGPGALGAQVTPPGAPAARRGWSAVRVSKWALLGATVGLGYYALKQSTRADRAYGDLRQLCRTMPTACSLDAGRYPDTRAEALYATSLQHDRRAQAGILGGQATLLASAALFVYDLRNGRAPGNIPFPSVGAALITAPAAPAPARAPAVALPRRFPPRAGLPALPALAREAGR